MVTNNGLIDLLVEICMRDAIILGMQFLFPRTSIRTQRERGRERGGGPIRVSDGPISDFRSSCSYHRLYCGLQHTSDRHQPPPPLPPPPSSCWNATGNDSGSKRQLCTFKPHSSCPGRPFHVSSRRVQPCIAFRHEMAAP